MIGMEKQQAHFKRMVQTGQVSHAFLFLGPSGVGKTSMALWVAQLLLCREGGCGVCPACVQITAGTHPDVLVIQKELDKKNISVEQIRELIQKMSQTSFLSSWKVGIIVEGGDLNAQASNALLKSLEEPTGKTVYIITSARESRILPTIHSRCQVMHFHPVSVALIQKMLEERGVSEASLWSTLCQGCVGKALKMVDHKEQVISALERLSQALSSDLSSRFVSVEGLWPVKTPLNEQVTVSKDLLDVWLSCYQIVLEGGSFSSSPFSLLKPLSRDQVASGIDQILKTKALLQENVNVKLALENLVLSL